MLYYILILQCYRVGCTAECYPLGPIVSHSSVHTAQLYNRTVINKIAWDKFNPESMGRHIITARLKGAGIYCMKANSLFSFLLWLSTGQEYSHWYSKASSLLYLAIINSFADVLKLVICNWELIRYCTKSVSLVLYNLTVLREKAKK